jgi:hypothetical protein
MWQLILNSVYDHFYGKYLAAIEASAPLIGRLSFLTH